MNGQNGSSAEVPPAEPQLQTPLIDAPAKSSEPASVAGALHNARDLYHLNRNRAHPTRQWLHNAHHAWHQFVLRQDLPKAFGYVIAVTLIVGIAAMWGVWQNSTVELVRLAHPSNMEIGSTVSIELVIPARISRVRPPMPSMCV